MAVNGFNHVTWHDAKINLWVNRLVISPNDEDDDPKVILFCMNVQCFDNIDTIPLPWPVWPSTSLMTFDPFALACLTIYILDDLWPLQDTIKKHKTLFSVGLYRNDNILHWLFNQHIKMESCKKRTIKYKLMK